MTQLIHLHAQLSEELMSTWAMQPFQMFQSCTRGATWCVLANFLSFVYPSSSQLRWPLLLPLVVIANTTWDTPYQGDLLAMGCW